MHCSAVQDHVVSGTLLTKRDTFLTRGEYMQLLYAACGPTRSGVRDAVDLQPCPPAILRPRTLWTGKQVCIHPASGQVNA